MNCFRIEEIIEDSVAAWRASPSDFPPLGPPFSPNEQKSRERRLDFHLDAVDAELRKTSRIRGSAEAALAHITSVFVQISTYALDIDDPYIENLLQNGFLHIARDLARRARHIDPNVSMIDILQAARNAWTACGLQVLLGRELRLTPAIFAYSMLYPYSDNYLDDAKTSPGAKLRFNERFRRRLEGEYFSPESRREDVICQLVELIESEYPRSLFPQVYASLLAIHAAQQDSVLQMQRSDGVDIARLTLTKGGTSVLADANLAAGSLTECEARFAFNWGVLLQLGDDLQDISSDRARGSRTLFTQTAIQGPLDQLTNRTFHFSRIVMEQMSGLPNASGILKQLLARSCQLLLIRNAANASQSYTGTYMAALETYSPFGFDFLRDREQRFIRRQRSYSRLFERAVG